MMSTNLHLGISVSLGILATMIAVLNILVIVLVVRNKHLRSYTNGFLVSLAVSDLLVGLAFIPGYIIEPGLEMNGYLIAIILLANIGNIVCVTAERLIAVLKPFSYAVLICKHFKKAIIGTWFIPTFVSLLPLVWKNHPAEMKIYRGFQVFIAVGLILCPYVFIIWAYWKIFEEVRRQLANMSRLNGLSGEANRRKQIQSEAKVAKVFASIAALATLSWLPVVYMTFCLVADRQDFIPLQLSIAHIFTMAINSIANPLVYCFYKEDFKRHLKIVFPCFSAQGVYKVREAQSFITLYSDTGASVLNDREGMGSSFRLHYRETTDKDSTIEDCNSKLNSGMDRAKSSSSINLGNGKIIGEVLKMTPNNEKASNDINTLEENRGTPVSQNDVLYEIERKSSITKPDNTNPETFSSNESNKAAIDVKEKGSIKNAETKQGITDSKSCGEHNSEDQTDMYENQTNSDAQLDEKTYKEVENSNVIGLELGQCEDAGDNEGTKKNNCHMLNDLTPIQDYHSQSKSSNPDMPDCVTDENQDLSYDVVNHDREQNESDLEKRRIDSGTTETLSPTTNDEMSSSFKLQLNKSPPRIQINFHE